MDNTQTIWIQNPETERIGYISYNESGEFESGIPKGTLKGGDVYAEYERIGHKSWDQAKRRMLRNGYTKVDENSLPENQEESNIIPMNKNGKS